MNATIRRCHGFLALSMACSLAALILLSGCTTLYGVYALLLCSESTVHFRTMIRVQDGHFGMHMWTRGFGTLSQMNIRCDSATYRRIHSLHYDTSKAVNPDIYRSKRQDVDEDTSKGTDLGTLKMYLKRKLVRETVLFPRGSSSPYSTEIGNTGWDIRADSLEIVNASPLLNGVQAEFVEYRRCMCRRDSGSGATDRTASAD
ncbi:MAG: hypothetical protein JF616_10020 [Fibrobacteres bacterium]|jgi:hypothetical protein|nr:hypothetical protein [Fibrobacterota bacterium]